MRRDYEDVSKQAERLTCAEVLLKGALEDLADEARVQSRARTPDTVPVIALMRSVERAEEERDIARLDLATARGEDA